MAKNARLLYLIGTGCLLVSSIGFAAMGQCAFTDSAPLTAQSALISQKEAQDSFVTLPIGTQNKAPNDHFVLSYAGLGSGGKDNFNQDIYFGGYDPTFLDSFSLKIGRLPENDNEILLTSYYVAAPNTFAIHIEEEILGKVLSLNEKEFVVTGILDDGLKFQEEIPFSSQRLAHRAIYLNSSSFRSSKLTPDFAVFKKPSQNELEDYLRKTHQAWHIDRIAPYLWLSLSLGTFALFASIITLSVFYKGQFEEEAKKRWETHLETHGRARIVRLAVFSSFSALAFALPIGFGLYFLANHYGAIHENVSFAPYPLRPASFFFLFLAAVIASFLSLGIGYLLFRKKSIH